MIYNAGKAIGPRFIEEIAGLADHRFAWGADGHFEIDDGMSPANVAALKAVIAAHDPAALPTPPTDTQLQARLDKFMLATALYFLDRVNELRVLPAVGLPALTPAQARQGIVDKYKQLP